MRLILDTNILLSALLSPLGNDALHSLAESRLS
jgi:predicted nucleic acid-binding protein